VEEKKKKKNVYYLRTTMLAETCRKVRLILDTKKQVAARD
jgi:hypothetical protein